MGCLPHDLDIQVAKLKMLKSNHMAQQYETEGMINKHVPQKMAEALLFIEALTADLPILGATQSRRTFFHDHPGQDLHRAQGHGCGAYAQDVEDLRKGYTEV